AADVIIDAEDLLDHDQPALRTAGGVGAITTELETVGSGQRNLRTQLGPPQSLNAGMPPGSQYSPLGPKSNSAHKWGSALSPLTNPSMLPSFVFAVGNGGNT